MLLVSVPLWITDFAPPDSRGILATVHAVMATVGYMLAAWIGVGFFYLETTNKWRGPLALACLPPLLNLAALLFVPESPRYLLMREMNTRARDVLIARYVDPTAEQDTLQMADNEFMRISSQLVHDRSLDSSWQSIFVRPSYRRRALISCSLLAFLYSSGTLTISS
jgi:hypothetical protein